MCIAIVIIPVILTVTMYVCQLVHAREYMTRRCKIGNNRMRVDSMTVVPHFMELDLFAHKGSDYTRLQCACMNNVIII